MSGGRRFNAVAPVTFHLREAPQQPAQSNRREVHHCNARGDNSAALVPPCADVRIPSLRFRPVSRQYRTMGPLHLASSDDAASGGAKIHVRNRCIAEVIFDVSFGPLLDRAMPRR